MLCVCVCRLETCKQELLKSEQQSQDAFSAYTCTDPHSPTTSSTSTTTVQQVHHESAPRKDVSCTASTQDTSCSHQAQQATASSMKHSQCSKLPLPTLELPPICGDIGSRICVHPSPESYSPDTAPLLGAVLGSQGDACKQMGALPAAAQLYAASADCLQRACGDRSQGGAPDQQVDEISHSLSVSINKLGDVQYMMQVST